MPITENDQLTPREYVLMENERDENRLIREHAVTLKQLEITLAKENHQADIELKRLESKWASLLKIPSQIIKLPIFFILSFGYLLAVIRKQEPPKAFWTYIS